MARDIFDFSDVSDLPEALRPRRPGPGPKNPGLWQTILHTAGRPVRIGELRAAGYRMTGKVAAAEVVDASMRGGVRHGWAFKVAPGLFVHRDHLKPGPIVNGHASVLQARADNHAMGDATGRP